MNPGFKGVAVWVISVLMGGMTAMWVVSCSVPQREMARQIGARLIETQAAACVKVVGGVESIYEWEGEVRSEGEVWLVIKTADYEAVERVVRELHPYEVPELVAMRVEKGWGPYVEWVERQAKK